MLFSRLSGGGVGVGLGLGLGLGVDSTCNNKVRNQAVVNATKQARGDADVTKKREELQRRIEETRRKLQSVSLVFQRRPKSRVGSDVTMFRVPGRVQVLVKVQPKHIRLEQPYTGEASSFE